MTTITIASSIPSNINTLEKLTAWSILASNALAGGLEVLETAGEAPISVAIASISQAADDTYRLSARLSLRLNANYMSDRSQKLWQFAEEWSSAALPAAFSAN